MPRKRELHDHYFKKAKAEGYAARSAYKLIQINDRRHILGPRMSVLDLGCAPGSWMQVAAQKVGANGRVVGLDLAETTADLPEWAVPLVGDVFAYPPVDLLAAAGLAPTQGFDVVLSDMAPNTTGSGDHFKSVELCRRVLALLPTLLRGGGSLAMKVFEGEEYAALVKETTTLFGFCRGYRPEATRDLSPEMFIIGDLYRGPRSAPGVAPPDGRAGLAPSAPKPRPGWGDGPGRKGGGGGGR